MGRPLGLYSAVTAAYRPSMCGIFVYRDQLSMDASQYTFLLLGRFSEVNEVRRVFNERGEGLHDWLKPAVNKFCDILSNAVGTGDYRSNSHGIFGDFL